MISESENHDQWRTPSFQANESLNKLLTELKSLLHPIQEIKQAEFTESDWPLGFIVGAPRSGTTLLTQWLSSLELFSYPSNLLTRFAYAPYIGALVQKMVFDKRFDFHGEFSDLESDVSFNSTLGKSKGALAVNEFQHFFRIYMPNFNPEFLDDAALSNVDFNGIKKGLASIESAFGKPFITKAIMLQYNISLLFENIPKSIFLYIERDPVFNMQSLLLAREEYYNNRNIWWSAKPKEYNMLKEMSIYHQIAGQVYFTNKSISDSLCKIPDLNKISVKYEEFCNNPKSVYFEVRNRYNSIGFDFPLQYSGVNSFEIRDELRITENELTCLKEAYDSFANRNE